MIEVSIQNKDPVINIDSDIIPSRPSISITGIPGGVCKCKITNHDTDYWNSNPLYIPKLNEIIIYSDYIKNGDTNVPAIKIGDGKAYVVDLPFVDNGNAYSWEKIGTTDIDLSDLGDLAYKDTVSVNVKPEGTVSKPTFTGDSMTSTGTFVPDGTVSQPTFTGTKGTVSVTGTPSGTISVGTGSANYTPAGTVSTPTITVTPNTATKYVAASATGGGSVTAGSAASCTLPTLAINVADETLTMSWTPGSFTTNTPTKVTLPSFASQTIVSGIKSATSSQPAFTGTGANLKFSGSSMSSSGDFTPAGTVSQPTFTGESGSVSVSGTPTGNVSRPTFTGTQKAYTGS